MSAFTGRKREKKTTRGIVFADFASKWIITLGGIGTIFAVLMVAVFLMWVVWPLFTSATVEKAGRVAAPWEERLPIHTDVDEYQHLGYALFADGSLTVFRVTNGEVVDQRTQLFDGQKLTAWSFSPGLYEAIFGFEDGTARLGRIGFAVSFLDESTLPADVRKLKPGDAVVHTHNDTHGILERTAENQTRFIRLSLTMGKPIETGSTTPVTAIDHAVSPSATRLVALHEDGSAFVEELRERTNVLTGEKTVLVRKADLPYIAPDGRGRPDYLKMSGLGDSVYFIWKDGLLARYDVRVMDNARFAEQVNLVEPDVWLTQVRFLLGKTTLVVADNRGDLNAWFPVRPQNASTPDGATLVKGSQLVVGDGAAVTTLSMSSRGRIFAAGYDNGDIRVLHGTSRKLVSRFAVEDQKPIRELTVTPKVDGVIAMTDEKMYRWHIDIGHPEATLASLFTPIWYESAEGPAHVWQSTGGTDDFEEKFGLYPLIFGTIKATVYSLLFGVPIALLAAIYTSEFMNPRIKAGIKPTIEMMASLPSVVLGFLAALVIAPFVENIVPAVIASFFCVPLMFLIGAYAWQLLPQKITLRLGQWRFLAILAMIPLGLGLSAVVGPVIEEILFAGDFKLWLDSDKTSEQFGSGFGGWMIILFPLSALLTAFLMSLVVNPLLRSASTGWSRGLMGVVDILKFFLGLGITLVVGSILSFALVLFGWDPRGGVLDTYVQRNALVVGFIMGFAIIPIIYTIAEDALSTVPEHLRSASLGCGATPWQTATRIVVPTAMSGLFSAVMIGLGRAVGETMIVLMAAGNTPVMEWNIFNGFRTLSANIAVELPEAVRDSTHYRTLYLAALVLFVMTFALNSVAESIRQRFRKRAYQL